MLDEHASGHDNKTKGMFIDMDKYVTSTGRSAEEINNYIRELRDNDRF